MSHHAKDLECRFAESSASSDLQGESAHKVKQPMAPSTYVLHNGASYPLRSEKESGLAKHSTEVSRSPAGLGFSSKNGTESRSPELSDSAKERELGVRAEASLDLLEGEIATNAMDYSLRPSALVRLLNSTELGEVLSERQLYRHRQRAPEIHSGPKRVDLLKYCAWLHVQRHKVASRKIRRRVGNLEVLTLGELRQILESQEYRCALSNEPLTPDNFALDHIIPVVEGGDFSASNCQLVTATVNRAKNTMSEKAFIEMCKRVAKHKSND